MEEHLLTVKQVAERLQINPVTLTRWLRAGRIRGLLLPADKLGWRIPESELQRIISDGYAAGEAEVQRAGRSSPAAEDES